MSVDFTASQSQTTTITNPCDFIGCCESDRCGYCDNGISEEREHEASINLSNASMAKLVYLLNLQEFCDYEESHGILHTAMGGVRQRIFRMRNQPEAREAATEAPSVITPGGWAGIRTETVDGVIQIHRMGPTIIHCGVTDERIIMQLEAMDAILAWAQERNDRVWWG